MITLKIIHSHKSLGQPGKRSRKPKRENLPPSALINGYLERAGQEISPISPLCSLGVPSPRSKPQLWSPRPLQFPSSMAFLATCPSNPRHSSAQTQCAAPGSSQQICWSKPVFLWKVPRRCLRWDSAVRKIKFSSCSWSSTPGDHSVISLDSPDLTGKLLGLKQCFISLF